MASPGHIGNGRGNGRIAGGRYRPMSEINVTPLVDVMLVLLVVFMVTAPLLTVGTQEKSASISGGSASNRHDGDSCQRPPASATCWMRSATNTG